MLEREPEDYFSFVEGYRRLFCEDWDLKKRKVTLRQPGATTPCFACGEPLVASWAYCPACGHPTA